VGPMKGMMVTMRKPLVVLLVVAMLTTSLGLGVASAASERPLQFTSHGSGGQDLFLLCNYTVRPGDTLTRIAIRFGTTVWYLASINGLSNPNRIYVGQHLFVPCRPAPPPPGPLCNYIVRPGDTLYRIALRFGTTVWYLASINGLSNPNRIYAWQHLWVPCRDP